jgi:hypothetical protein
MTVSHPMVNFIDMLKNESWDNTLLQNDINKSFNSPLNTFLIFLILFSDHVTSKTNKKNCWITTGIRISCKHKKYLYILSKNSNSCKIKAYCTQYCIVLRKIVRKAKQMCYSQLLVSSNNKSKTPWNIIKSETGKANSKVLTLSEFKLGIKNIHVNQVAESFNNFCLKLLKN